MAFNERKLDLQLFTKGETKVRKRLIMSAFSLGMLASLAAVPGRTQDKMPDDKMATDKMATDKMSTDKMADDKMDNKMDKKKSKKKNKANAGKMDKMDKKDDGKM